LFTCAFDERPVQMQVSMDPITDAVLAWDDDTVTYAGPRSGWDGQVDEELAGRTIVPGFVDSHTHLPFYGWRDDEFEARLAGTSYAQQHGEGGISRSARMLAEASDEEVLEFCAPLLIEMAAHGTTALELKTGYGLSLEAEHRQAGLARRLAEEAPQTGTVTLLAGHSVPEGTSAEAWVRLACDELIPRAAGEGLCDAIDSTSKTSRSASRTSRGWPPLPPQRTCPYVATPSSWPGPGRRRWPSRWAPGAPTT
jgi:imidazolonepropionase